MGNSILSIIVLTCLLCRSFAEREECSPKIACPAGKICWTGGNHEGKGLCHSGCMGEIPCAANETCVFDVMCVVGFGLGQRRDAHLSPKWDCPEGIGHIISKTTCEMACKQLGLPIKGKFSDGSLCYQKINKKGKAICAQNGKYGKNKKNLPVCDIRWLYDHSLADDLNVLE